MTNEAGSDTIERLDEMGDVLSRVRRLDPTTGEAAVRGYVREMAETDVVLDTVDLDDVPLLVAFSPSWPEGRER
jgi:hypothetical protein